MRRNFNNEVVRELSDLVENDEVTVWNYGVPCKVCKITKILKTQLILDDNSRWTMRGDEFGSGRFSKTQLCPFEPSDLIGMERDRLITSIRNAFYSGHHARIPEETVRKLTTKLLEGVRDPYPIFKDLWNNRIGRNGNGNSNGIDMELLRELDQVFYTKEPEPPVVSESAV
jgi:hypothetical protein